MMKTAFVRIILLPINILFVSCATNLDSPVPGMQGSSDSTVELSREETYIRETVIMEAMKCQMARGFEKVEEYKSTSVGDIDELRAMAPTRVSIGSDTYQVSFSDNDLRQLQARRLDQFQFENGSGTLSGKMQIKTINGLSFSVAFPFGGYDRTDDDASAPGTGTPSIGQSLTSTSVQEVKRTFDIAPGENASTIEFCKQLESVEQIDIGTFITDSIVSAFTSFANVRIRGIEPIVDQSGNLLNEDGQLLEDGADPEFRIVAYSPVLRSTISETTTSFSVVKKPEGGFSIVVIPTAPRLTEANASASASQERTDIYTLTTKLPTKIGQSSDSRRLHYCLNNARGGQTCIEEPFDVDRLEFYQQEMNEDSFRFGVNAIGQVVIQSGATREQMLAQLDDIRETREELRIARMALEQESISRAPAALPQAEPDSNIEAEVQSLQDELDRLQNEFNDLRDTQNVIPIDRSPDF